jgi:hypothetical protein
LHNFGGLKFLSKIIGKPTFRINLYDRVLEGDKEFKNSVIKIVSTE